MTATATTATWKQPSHAHTHSRSSRPSTTPRGYVAVSSVGQSMPPQTSPSMRSSHTSKNPKSPDSGYFGFVVNDESIPPDSGPGQHTKQNWAHSGSSRGSAIPAPRMQSNETNPEYEAFRRQSQQYGFELDRSFSGFGRTPAQGNVTPTKRAEDSPISPASKRPFTLGEDRDSNDGGKKSDLDNPFFDGPVHSSPKMLAVSSRTVSDHQHARLSLPSAKLKAPLDALQKKRAETLPQTGEKGPQMLAPTEIAKILETKSKTTLLLDLRVYPQYAAGRIKGALNLCIPTTLLKRPSYTVEKLADTFNAPADRAEFSRWQDCEYIIVYDANCMQAKEAIMPFNVLKKFATSGWSGDGYVIKGGFHSFSKQFPNLIDKTPTKQNPEAAAKSPSASPPSSILAVAGGCTMPSDQSAVNPFFGNIRQNQDLMDGVGQMPIKKPMGMSSKDSKSLPTWLREAAAGSDEGKQVSDKFLSIERSEQKRMQQALSGNVSYGSPGREKPEKTRLAGIEKGSKNRYNNIFPFDHSRVKLRELSNGGCDYVNANFVKAKYSHRNYIATQAPIPATFEDFWKVVWEQDVKVIVMLTAESEGGQVKSHAYWNSGDYGVMKLKKLSDRQTPLEKSKQRLTPNSRPTLGSRRSTQPYTLGERKVAEDTKGLSNGDTPTVVVRHFSLSHSGYPFQPMKEVTQLQYTQWPDFGAPASPTAILGLIEQVNKYTRTSGSPSATHPGDVAPEKQPPILVHCSAGCGRTGTFCTVDSVIDMLKRQKLERDEKHFHRAGSDEMDLDEPDDWVSRDDIDLVAKTVDDFRHQRLSMVQNLRQFVLCYESVLQWIITQEHKQDSPDLEDRDGRGKSYQGTLSVKAGKGGK